MPDLNGEFIAVIAVAGGFIVAIFTFTLMAVTRIARTRMRERSRREIAAYVAEGSISPEDACRLIEDFAQSRDA
jgi:hypothetical protein